MWVEEAIWSSVKAKAMAVPELLELVVFNYDKSPFKVALLAEFEGWGRSM